MSEAIHFDPIIERRKTDSIKWNLYPPDVLPLWVADMDFRSPDCVIDRLSDRIQHGIFGYGTPSEKLIGLIIGRLWEKYRWRITPEMIVFVPGVVTGLNLFCQAFRQNSEKVVVQTPVYPPIFQAPANAGLSVVYSHLVQTASGRYEMDLDDLESKFAEGAKSFILCNPHNPVGRVFTQYELQRVADLCNQYGVTVCSDEIHGDLVFDGHIHIPLASIDSEIEQRTVTYLAPSKTFNIAGLECAFAVIPNQGLRSQYVSARKGIVPYVNILGYIAAEAAYEGGEEWLGSLLGYLARNRDFLQRYIKEYLPEIKVYPAEGTYLAWLDCRELQMDDPYKFFLETCKVGLNNGIDFCEGGEGFVRLNFGCPLEILKDALERIRRGLRP